MINKKHMIEIIATAIITASLVTAPMTFTTHVKAATKSITQDNTPSKKGNATGNWYGSIFGMTVTLHIKDDGTYDINFEDRGNETGTWCLNGDNVITDKASEEETVYVFNGTSLITKINGETLKLTRDETNATEKSAAISNKEVNSTGFNGVWKANKVEIGKLSVKPDTFGITNAFLEIKNEKANIFLNSTSLTKPIEINDINGTFKNNALEFTTEKDNKTLTVSMYILEDNTIMCILKVDGYEMKLYLEETTEKEMEEAKKRCRDIRQWVQ